MKKTLLRTFLWGGCCCVTLSGYAQCQFLSPAVELNSIYTDTAGNCVVNMNLGFEIDINNGNKIIFVHLWRTQDYTTHNYTNQNQPKENNILNDALATIIIDNDLLNNNPSASANQVFMTTYGPDPGINDNIAPAVYQVKDASDGLTYNRVVVNGPLEIYRYTINNLTLVLPGACAAQVSFTGDAWSSNANSSNPPVQCSMTGFSFLANDPAISSTFTCMPMGSSNTYAYAITTNTSGQLSFYTDVYVDNGDDFFDIALDIPVASNAGPHTATSATSFYSGVSTYPAPYSTTMPDRLRNLWVVVKNMSVTENNITTTISNSLIERVINTCNITVLPLKLMSFTGERAKDKVIFDWQLIQSEGITAFILQRKNDGGIWDDIQTIPAVMQYNVLLNYHGTDYSAPPAQNLYRLKILSETGNEDYSQEIRISASAAQPSCIISPNPSLNGEIQIALHTFNSRNDIRLYDVGGRLIQSGKADEKGKCIFSKLLPGTYFIRVTGDAGTVPFLKKAIVLSR